MLYSALVFIRTIGVPWTPSAFGFQIARTTDGFGVGHGDGYLDQYTELISHNGPR